MTLVVAANSPESIWLLADRRLTYGDDSTRDDARKVMFLETTDGLAILGYSGLGITDRGTEPVDWMSNVLRGRSLLLEASLEVLSQAVKKHLPQHLVRLHGTGGPSHSVIVPAFVGSEVRVYSIDIQFSPDRKSYGFRCSRYFAEDPASKKARAPRLWIGGSGAPYLGKRKEWVRELLSILKAHDSGRLSSLSVANHLAKLNYGVSRNVTSVGPRCIVAWRNRKNGVHGSDGGGQRFYTRTTRDAGSPALPTIANGIDMRAFLEVVKSHFIETLSASKGGGPAKELDKDRINADLACLPDKPNETLT